MIMLLALMVVGMVLDPPHPIPPMLAKVRFIDQQTTALPPWEQRLLVAEAKIAEMQDFAKRARVEAQLIIDNNKSVVANQRERIELLSDRVAKLEQSSSEESVASVPAVGPDDVQKIVDAARKPGGPDWETIGAVVGAALLTMGNSYLNRRSVKKHLDTVTAPVSSGAPLSGNSAWSSVGKISIPK